MVPRSRIRFGRSKLFRQISVGIKDSRNNVRLAAAQERPQIADSRCALSDLPDSRSGRFGACGSSGTFTLRTNETDCILN